MPFRPMMLRDSKVFARCDDNGELEAVSGRVEIRYRKGAGKAYQAGVRNLSPIAGSTIEADESFPTESPDTARASATTKKRTAKSSASKKSSRGPVDHPENAIIAYGDGACSGNPGPAGLGVVVMMDGKRFELSEYLGQGTNNIAELTAMLRVAEKCAGQKVPVHAYTDSSYSIGVLTQGWKAKANQELVATVKAALCAVPEIHLHYVKGHAGIELNERADELAREAVQNRASRAWQVI